MLAANLLANYWISKFLKQLCNIIYNLQHREANIEKQKHKKTSIANARPASIQMAHSAREPSCLVGARTSGPVTGPSNFTKSKEVDQLRYFGGSMLRWMLHHCSPRIKEAGIAIRYLGGYSISILQGPEMGWKSLNENQNQRKSIVLIQNITTSVSLHRKSRKSGFALFRCLGK